MAKGLNFEIKLTDKFSKTMKYVQNSSKAIENINRRISSANKNIVTNGLAIWGVVKSFQAITAPAQAMQSALSAAGSSGVNNLENLRKQAKSFSNEYGTNAIDFISSTAGIKTALSGISDEALPHAVKSVNLLAKATGASVEDSTKYLSQMVNDYKGTYAELGRYKFTVQVGAMASYAKNNFNLSPESLQNMMSKTKSAQSLGVGMDDQMATLGVLSKTMGANAGVGYENMLKNMGAASKELGMSFTDTNGKLLQTPEILAKIQDKFGKNIDGNIKAQQMLDKAFGTGAPALKTLLKNEEQVNHHLNEIGKNKGLAVLEKSALANVNPWDQINSKLENTKESIGRALLPVLLPVINSVSDLIGKFARWADLFPNIAKWIGIVFIGLTSFVVIGAIFGMVTSAVGVLIPILSALIPIFTGIISLFKVLRVLVMTNPLLVAFTLIVGAIYLIYQNWDSFVRMLMNNKVVQFFIGIAKSMANIVKKIINTIKNIVIDSINWIIEKVNLIPGVNIDLIARAGDEESNIDANLKASTTVTTIDNGGISKEINNSKSNAIDNSQKIGTVNIEMKSAMTPDDLREWEALQHG